METTIFEESIANKEKQTENSNSNGEQNLAEQYRHIKGWGIDADPENEPTYPMKHYTGDDHKRLEYERPAQQPVDIEVLRSIERPAVSAAFGTVSPPSGLSGAIRRFAFRFSEDNLKHWFALVLADRVNVLEGFIEDIRNRHIPNIFAEKGIKAEWQYNRKSLIKRAAITTAVATTVFLLVSRKRKAGRQKV